MSGGEGCRRGTRAVVGSRLTLSSASLKPRQNVLDLVPARPATEINPRQPQPLHLARGDFEPIAYVGCCEQSVSRKIPECAICSLSLTVSRDSRVTVKHGLVFLSPFEKRRRVCSLRTAAGRTLRHGDRQLLWRWRTVIDPIERENI